MAEVPPAQRWLSHPSGILGVLMSASEDEFNHRLHPERPLSLQCLGESAVSLGDAPLKFATRHAAKALFSLLLAHEHVMNVEELGERLWPDAPHSALPRRLATMTWQLRRGLEEAGWRVTRSQDELRLTLLPDDEVDLFVLREEAERVLQGKTAPSQTLLTKLKERVLPEWATEHWVTAEQRSWSGLGKKVALISR